MQRNVEQQKAPWNNLLHDAGIRYLWPWQEDVIHAWESKDSYLVRLPKGGGRGFCSLLIAQQAPSETVIVCSTSAQANRRHQQAQQLGWPVLLWDGTTPYPEAPEHPVLTWSEALATGNTPAWESHITQRAIFDGLKDSKSTPEFWKEMSKLATRWVFFSEAFAPTWWSDDENHAGWKELNVATEEGEIHWLDENANPEKATTWLVGSSDENDWLAQLPSHQSPAFALGDPSHIKLDTPPASLSLLGQLSRRCTNLVLGSTESEPDNTAGLYGTVKQWLSQQADPVIATTQYIRTGDLLHQLGQPVTPQPVFERGLKELDECLQQISQEGIIEDLKEVSFQIKIHSINRLQEKALQDKPALLAFWHAYEGMRQNLSTLDSFALTFFNGKSFDLRKFAERLPYDVAQLNQIFQELKDQNLAITTLETSHGGYNKEYQLTLPPHTQVSPSIKLLQQSGEHKTDLLWSALSTSPQPEDEALLSLLHESPSTLQFWETAQQKLPKSTEQERWIRIAGRVLQQMEKQESSALQALWILSSNALQINEWSAKLMLPLLPPASEVPASLSEVLKPLLAASLRREDTSQPLYEYCLILPESFGFEEHLDDYLKTQSEHVLRLSSVDSNASELQRFVNLAQRQMTSSQIGLGGEDLPLPPRPWSFATGWAHALLGQEKAAWTWIASTAPEGPQQALRGVTIALSVREAQKALEWLECNDIQAKLTPAQTSELYRQLFAICKAQARCKACPLQASSFCPSGLTNLLALAEKRPELSSENYQYCLSKRIRADLEKNSSDALREVLGTPSGQQSERVQRAVLSQLHQRDEASQAELKKLAAWAESYGDYRNAQKYRETIHAQDGSDADNLQKLAHLYLRQDEVMLGLKFALEATHNHPRRYPLEPWVKQHHSRLLSKPEMLREALLELPAHPALSKLEEELTAHEELLKQLKPKIAKAEEAMEATRWGEAKSIAEGLLNDHPQHTPARIQQILNDIKQEERKLWQQIQRPPRNPKKRNQLLEKVANDASKHGLENIMDGAFKKLLRMSPQYGLGYLKWARLSQNEDTRHQAYQKSISLSRTPQQTTNNLEEYVRYLNSIRKLPKVLPLLLELIQVDEPPIPRALAERLLTKLSEEYGTQDDVTSKIQEFMEGSERGKSFKKLKKKVAEVENLEPWKRALLSLKNKQ